MLIAALLVTVNDACLTRVYGVLPRFIGGDWNWQGKLLALAETLIIAAATRQSLGASAFPPAADKVEHD